MTGSGRNCNRLTSPRRPALGSAWAPSGVAPGQPFPPLRFGARGAFDRGDQDVEAERLGDVGVAAGVPRGVTEIFVGRRRHEDDREGMAHRPDLRRQIDPEVAVQVQIGDEARRLVEVGGIAKRLGAREGFQVEKPCASGRRWICRQHARIVVDDNDLCHGPPLLKRCHNAAVAASVVCGGRRITREHQPRSVDFGQSFAGMRHILKIGAHQARLSTGCPGPTAASFSSPSHLAQPPPTLPLPATRLCRAWGGRSAKPSGSPRPAAPVSGREGRVRPILPAMGLLLAPLPAGASFSGAPSGSAGLSRRHAG